MHSLIEVHRVLLRTLPTIQAVCSSLGKTTLSSTCTPQQVTTIPVTNEDPAKLPGSSFAAQCCTILQLIVLKNSILNSSQTEYSPHPSTRSHSRLHQVPPPRASNGPLAPSFRRPSAIPTVAHQPGSLRHPFARVADRHGSWPLPPAPRRSGPRASQRDPGCPKGKFPHSPLTTPHKTVVCSTMVRKWRVRKTAVRLSSTKLPHGNCCRDVERLILRSRPLSTAPHTFPRLPDAVELPEECGQ